MKLRTMMVTPKPTKPPPVISPNSLCVKPNCSPQSPMISPRTENPMPAAINVKKLAQKSIMWLNDGEPDADESVCAYDMAERPLEWRHVGERFGDDSNPLRRPPAKFPNVGQAGQPAPRPGIELLHDVAHFHFPRHRHVHGRSHARLRLRRLHVERSAQSPLSLRRAGQDAAGQHPRRYAAGIAPATAPRQGRLRPRGPIHALSRRSFDGFGRSASHAAVPRRGGAAVLHDRDGAQDSQYVLLCVRWGCRQRAGRLPSQAVIPYDRGRAVSSALPKG